MNPAVWLSVEIVEGPNQGRRATVDANQSLAVGRSATSEFAVMDPRMSRTHFQIEFRNGNWCIRDLASSNGTQVNAASVRESVIRDGDIVSAGDTRFRVSLEGPQRPVARTTKMAEPSREMSAANRRTWIAEG